ncbi:MAG TPA: hypothetical protein DDZ84_01830, partial [Firmicutes bacterium]|nr:hypothetical protein [Bacillota bacterium]
VTLQARWLVPTIGTPSDLQADRIDAPVSLVASHLFPVIANADGGDEPRATSTKIVIFATIIRDPGSSGFLQLLPPLGRVVGCILLMAEDL